jgi:hypothetical protein
MHAIDQVLPAPTVTAAQLLFRTAVLVAATTVPLLGLDGTHRSFLPMDGPILAQVTLHHDSKPQGVL